MLNTKVRNKWFKWFRFATFAPLIILELRSRFNNFYSNLFRIKALCQWIGVQSAIEPTNWQKCAISRCHRCHDRRPVPSHWLSVTQLWSVRSLPEDNNRNRKPEPFEGNPLWRCTPLDMSSALNTFNTFNRFNAITVLKLWNIVCH